MKTKDEKILERILKALANHRRLKILRFLKKKPEASVGTVAAEIKLSLKSTSKHLNILAISGIVDKKQRSLLMFYYLASDMPQPARHIINLL